VAIPVLCWTDTIESNTFEMQKAGKAAEQYCEVTYPLKTKDPCILDAIESNAFELQKASKAAQQYCEVTYPTLIGQLPENRVVKPTVLPTVGRRGLGGVLRNIRSWEPYGLP
jgi:hypothetical protein